MRISKKVGPVTVRTSSRGGVGLSVGSNGTRISTSMRKGKEKGKLASGCAGIVVIFIVLAVILAMCSPKDDKNDTADGETLSAVETLAPETEALSRSLPAETEEPEILTIEKPAPEPVSSAAEEPVTEEPAAPVEEPVAPASETPDGAWTPLVSEEIASQNTDITREGPEDPYWLQNTYEHDTTELYVLNTHTQKVHKSTCNDVQKIKPENYATTNNPGEYLANGYTNCGHCGGY